MTSQLKKILKKDFDIKILAKLTISNIFNIERVSNGCTFIIFSKDRPLQLYSLLRSLDEKVSGNYQVLILLKATNENYTKAYQEVLYELRQKNITVFWESHFSQDLEIIISSCKFSKVCFLVDDIVFIDAFNTEWLNSISLKHTVPSLRLSSKINFCQVINKECQPPKITRFDISPWKKFNWIQAKTGYWSLPTSLDGHFFALNEISILLKNLHYSSPNSLEREIGKYRFFFKYRVGICLESAAIINFALNRVQTDNTDFPCADYSASYFLEKWNLGLFLDIEKMLKSTKLNSCHITTAPSFKHRQVLSK